MTRHLIFAVVLALLTTRLSADEPWTWISDSDSSPQATSLGFGADAPNQTEGLPIGYYFETAFEDSEGAEPLPEGNAGAAKSIGRGFHPVWDCGCSIPSLDHWCDCSAPCCTTDCWVDHPCQSSQGGCYLTEDDRWMSDDAFCDVSGRPNVRSNTALRFGWWGVDTDGSPAKIGEFQDLEPSPFWDADAISSDGVRTWDVTLSGLDNEASNARVDYYGPAVSAKVDYQRYIRRLEHDPLTGYDLDNPVLPGANDNVVSQDLNVGQDYAFRVQELDARFKGRLTDNLKWRLNLWGQRKFGQRQTNAVAHCFASGGAAANTCHVVSQGQTIDWLTMEIQPVVEAEFENVTVEYSHTMRSFNQDDELATRQYTRFNFSPASGTLGPDYAYALVPENVTQIDRLKINARLTETTQLYGNLYNGDTRNEFRDTHRRMNGYDVRLTTRPSDELTLTGYSSRYEETNQIPSTFLTAPPYAPANTYDQDSLRHPIDYTRTRAGIKGSWRPYGDRHSCSSYGLLGGTSLAGGYQYYQLEREYATYDTAPAPPGPFSQPDTITHEIHFGPTTRWSSSMDTFTRYKVRFIDDPLVGVSEYSEDDPDVTGLFNSNLPEQVHSVELGGTWTPTDNFMATVQFTIENSWHESQYANFTENNYPIVCTVWYAPTRRWSLTGGYAYFSNWIDQDITLGANRGDPTETETTRWNYAGENHLVSFNAGYALNECVQLVGGYEWNRGTNAFNLPASQQAGVDWTLLPFLSDVIVETNRVTAGVDWQPSRYMDVYFRYILFDYNDLSSGSDSGISHMALAGAGVNW